MYKILNNKKLNDSIYQLDIEAPIVASKYMPGQYVIVMANSDSERIPLTIYDVNGDTVSLIYQVVGASTLELSKVRDNLYALVGPLGNPSELVNTDLKAKNILLVCGGVGSAAIYPQAKYFKAHGSNVDIIYGAKNKDALIIEDELMKVSNNLYLCTDDGSVGFKGNVVEMLKTLDNSYDVCVAIGPMVMMKYVSLYTKEINLKTIVSMNPIMVDGTGMCGACRLVVNNEVRFACVDGPEFDGHQVDFDLAIKRMNMYKTTEGKKYLEELEGNTHHGGCGNCGDKHE